MILNLCNTSDSLNTINKTLNVVETINVVLRNDFNLLDPILMLTFEDAQNALDYNYFEFPEMGRKYVAVSSELVNDKMVKFSCTLDVLETFKADILNSEFSFNRSIRPGDYESGELPETTFKTVSKYDSDKTFNSGISQILVTVGGYGDANN